MNLKILHLYCTFESVLKYNKLQLSTMKIITKQNKSILRELVSTDFKIRYQGSFLGYAWSLFRPLMLFCILYIVFTYVFGLGKTIPHYPVYLLLGIVLWNFMLETTSIGVSSIVSNGNLLRKINIPKYLPVLSSSLSSLINLFFNLLVVFGFILFSGISPNLFWLVFPVIVFELYVFSLSLAFLLSALYVKYRDINYIWELALQAGFYLTPIIYPISKAPVSMQKIIFLNPMAQIIQDSRWLIISRETATASSALKSVTVLIPYTLVLLVLLVSTLYFKNRAAFFAEEV